MSETLTRSFGTPDLEVRSAEQRIISGIAVPYGVHQRINPRLTECFARGAFNRQLDAAHRVKVAREHLSLGGSLIGRVVELRDDAKGLYAEMRISETPLGDETLELVRDGALTDLSIGFLERQNRKLAGGVIERTTAHLAEIAIVLQGAYGEGAMVSGVRSDNATPNLDAAAQVLAQMPVLSA